MKYSTIEYLYKNELNLVTALSFTINNLVYFKNNDLTKLFLNEKKPTSEELIEVDIILRLEDLYKISVVTRAESGVYNHAEYIANIDNVFSRLEKDFDLKINHK